MRADPVRHDDERPAHQGAGAADQAGISVRPGSRDRRTDLADRRAAGAAVDGAEREDQPDAALSNQAGAIRPAGLGIDDLIDFTPALRAEAIEIVKRYQIGPLFTPPVLSSATVRSRRCRCPRTTAAPTGLAAHSIPRPTASTSTRTRPSSASASCPPIRRRRTWATCPDSRAARRRRPWTPSGDGAGAAAHQAALRPDHRLRHEHGRPGLAEDSQLDAGRNREPSRAEGPGPAAAGSARANVHRRARDQDAADRRERAASTRTRPANASRCCARTTRPPAPTPEPSTCQPSRPDRR